MNRSGTSRVISLFLLLSILTGSFGPFVPVAQAAPAQRLPSAASGTLWDLVAGWLGSMPLKSWVQQGGENDKYTFYLPIILQAWSATNLQLQVTSESGGSLRSKDGTVRLDVPVGAVKGSVSIEMMQETPVEVSGYQAAGAFFTLTAQDAAGDAVTTFERNLKITVDYDSNVDPTTLALYYYDPDLGWQPVPSRIYADRGQVVGMIDHFTRFALLSDSPDGWAVGNIVGLCEGTEIRTDSGDEYQVHTTVPEDDWAVKVIDGPRYVAGEVWWDTSRREAGDPSGGTGWIKQSQAEESCSGDGGGDGNDEGVAWAVDVEIGLCLGTEIRHGPRLVVHTVVPEDDWTVRIVDGPRVVDGVTWWDTSRAAAGDPSGGTGWVSQEQAEAACNGQGSDLGVLGPVPLSLGQRQLYRMLGNDQNQEQFSAADPVYPPTGNLTQQFTDLSIPGTAGFDLVLTRFYNSRDTRDGVFGMGYSSLLDMALRLANDGSVDVRFPDGHGLHFVVENGEAYVPGSDDNPATLTYTGDRFELKTLEQVTYVFDASGSLFEFYDRYDNTITFQRDGEGRVTRLVDTAGREFSLTYSGDHVAGLSDPLGRAFSYTYTAAGELQSFTNANGGTYRFTYQNQRLVEATDPEDIDYLGNVYDGEGRVTEQIDASGHSCFFDYGTPGEVRYTDNLGRDTVYRFDDNFMVTEVEDVLGHADSYAYDADFNLIRYVDRNDGEWTYTYDGRGNRLSERGPEDWHITYTYDGENHLTSVKDALDRLTQYTWTDGCLTRVEQADGAVQRYAYDGFGQLQSATDPNGHISLFVYDAESNLIEVRSPLVRTTHYTYDAVGRLLTMVDANGGTVQLAYDPGDNLVSLVDPRGSWSTFSYDANDMLIEMMDRRGGVWTYAYDENLKLVAETDPESHTSTYIYDAMYNRVSTTDPRGNCTQFQYDALGRLVAVVDALGNITRLTYDPKGNLTEIIDALGQETQVVYDGLDRANVLTDAAGQQTTFVYDVVGHLLETVDPRGARTSYDYDAVDQLVRSVDALSGETLYDYDMAGNLVKVTDANRHATSFRYDAENRLTAIEDPQGYVVSYDYDGVGNVVRQIDARGYITGFEYDENGNLTTVVDALLGETVYVFDAEDDLAAMIDANGHATQIVRNEVGLPVTLIEAGGQETLFAYDASYNLVSLVDARGNAYSYAFDALSRLIKVTDPLGHATVTDYDVLGRRIAETNALGVTTGFAYDALGQLTSVIENYRPDVEADSATNVRTSYDYDAAGNLTRVLDANGSSTVFSYDLLGRLVHEVNPLGQIWRYHYDPVGNLIERVDAKGHATAYTYNAADRLISIDYPDAGRISFAYDENYNQVAMTDGLGTTLNTFDALNRLTSATNHLEQTVGYSYDAVGNRTAITYPDGRVLHTAYDVTNYPVRITDPEGRAFETAYNATHNVIEVLYPNQTQTKMAYDAADRLTSMVSEQLDGDVISGFDYTLDAVGNRTQVQETYRWHKPEAVATDYVYDELYRLVRSEDSEGRFTDYVYDAAGNRERLESNYDPLRTPTDVTPYSVAYTYNRANQLQTTTHSVFGVTTYSYDENGNRVRREGPDVWVGNKSDTLRTDYTYDYENRLTGISNFFDSGNGKWSPRDDTEMIYDGYGRLYRRLYDAHQGSGGQKWVDLVYDGLDPIAEYVEPGSQYDYYYHGLGRILEMQEFKSQEAPEGTVAYYHYDGLGSVSALTKHQGQSVHAYRYGDYGMLLDKNDGTADASNFTNPHNHYTYTGQNWDTENALYHFYAREYDPVTGVWLQQDPYRGRLGEPETLHRYGYVGANPVNFVDRYGFERRQTIYWNELRNSPRVSSSDDLLSDERDPLLRTGIFLRDTGRQFRALFSKEFWESGAWKCLFRFDTYTDRSAWRRAAQSLDDSISFLQMPAQLLSMKADESEGLQKHMYQLGSLVWKSLPPISVPSAFGGSISADIKYLQGDMDLKKYIGTQVESVSGLLIDRLGEAVPAVRGRKPNFGTEAFFAGKHTQRDALESVADVMSEWTTGKLGELSEAIYSRFER